MATATEWLWERLHRPADEVQVARAVLGIDEAAARRLVARLLLDSDEAGALLDATPGLLRTLRNQQGSEVRTEASIRGPVLWAATISHRAASGFADDLYVCAVAVRDHDVAENRVLAAALAALRQAGRHLHQPGATATSDDPRTGAASRAVRAAALADHRRLRGVPTRWPARRDLAKVRSGRSRAAYGPALALLDRVARGPDLVDLAPAIDGRNQAHHELLRVVVAEVERTGALVEPFRPWDGQLHSGPLRYLPPVREGPAGPAGGVVLPQVAFTLADPGRPGPGHGGGPLPTTGSGPTDRPVVVVGDHLDVREALIQRRRLATR